MSINLARYYPYTLLVSVLQPTNSSIVSLEVKDFHRFRENLIWNFSPYDPIYIEGICSNSTELLDHHYFKFQRTIYFKIVIYKIEIFVLEPGGLCGVPHRSRHVSIRKENTSKFASYGLKKPRFYEDYITTLVLPSVALHLMSSHETQLLSLSCGWVPCCMMT